MIMAVCATLVGLATSASTAESVPAVRHASIEIRHPGVYVDEYLGAMQGRIVVGFSSPAGCQVAELGPSTLRLTSDERVGCDDPLLAGENVMPVETVSRASQYGEVRIAVRDSATGAVHEGPVVMRYGNFSDTRPEWAYGGGYLWLFDVGIHSGPNSLPRLPAELLRISATSGAVEASVPMPPIDRITMAADDDGLWFAPSIESGWPAGGAPPKGLLYFISRNALRPRVVQAATQNTVSWIAAVAHTAWAGAAHDGQQGAITETLSSPDSRPQIVHDPAGTPVPSDIGEGPYDAAPVLTAPGVGLVAAQPGWLGDAGLNNAEPQTILKLDPATGRATKLTSVSISQAGSLEANIVFGHQLYLLVGKQQGSTAAAVLYRVPF
jgi:hypothetical protein